MTGSAPSVDSAFFETLYRGREDPWGFASRPYETHRYDRMLAALGSRRWDRALELGCSIGVFTARLAERCDALEAVDGSLTAVRRARARLAARPTVTVAHGVLPGDLASGPFSLIVCADILYYLSEEALDGLLPRLVEALEPGGTLLAAHWRGETAPAPLSGDDVHARLLALPGLRHRLDAREPRFRLDRWESA